MNRRIQLGLAAATLAAVPLVASPPAAAPAEALLLFHDGAVPAPAQLAAIEQEASELGVPLSLVDVRESGAPPEVQLVPLLLYQNHRGRSIFQGRHADAGKVSHFVRTARFVPQGNGAIERADVATRQLGRMTLALSVKVTGLGGTLPDGHDAAAFEASAREAVFARLGELGFQHQASALLDRSDRTFYLDFYPWRGEDGTWWVTPALYSQFHCHEPVFMGLDEAPSAPTLEGAFAAAAQMLADRVEVVRTTSTIGDDFNPVGTEVASTTLEALGFPLPPPPAAGAVAAADVSLDAREWVVDLAASGGAPIQFQFPAPLDNYTGVARDVEGLLVLAGDGGLAGASASVQVATPSVTMGETGLDDWIHGANVLAIDDFPAARFVLREFSGDLAPLAFGEPRQLVATGDFSMVGLTTPLSATVELLPVVNEAGEARLETTAQFRVNIRDPFGIDGPDGPEPASSTLEFFVRGALMPRE